MSTYKASPHRLALLHLPPPPLQESVCNPSY